LNTAYKNWINKGHASTDWDALSMTELIDYITKTYHDPLEQELSALNGFVTRVLTVHGKDHPHLEEIYNLYNLLNVDGLYHELDRKSTRLNSSHVSISYTVFCST